MLAALNVVVPTVFGGGELERYLLPVLPILYTAMAAGLSLFPRRPRLICSATLLVGVAAGIFINPPYPFPYEDNLAFADFVHLQSAATDYLNRWYPDARVTTVWPLTLELSRPELGYVDRRIAVTRLPNLSAEALTPVDWDKVQVMVAFSRNWDSNLNLMHWEPVRRFWSRYFGYVVNGTREETLRRVPLPLESRFEQRGQWLDIYVNPTLPRTVQGPALRAAIKPATIVRCAGDTPITESICDPDPELSRGNAGRKNPPNLGKIPPMPGYKSPGIPQ